jgi:type II secretion system protein G
MSRFRRGFTLIELLIVVAIIAILALIAVPNFLEAQTRAKVSRSKTDMRTISVGFEAYHVDWGCYPRDQDNWVPSANPDENGFTQITTPVAYLTSIPADPFFSARGWSGSGDRYAPFYEAASEVITMPSTSRNSGKYDCYCINGLGPDSDDDFSGNDLWPDNSGSLHGYDPTNGTVSNGDIYRFGGMFKVGQWDYNERPWQESSEFGF